MLWVRVMIRVCVRVSVGLGSVLTGMDKCEIMVMHGYGKVIATVRVNTTKHLNHNLSSQ